MKTLDITYPSIHHICSDTFMLHGELTDRWSPIWKYLTQVFKEYNQQSSGKNIDRSYLIRAYQWHIKKDTHILRNFIAYIKTHLTLNIICNDTKNNTENILTWPDISNTCQHENKSMWKLSNTIVSYIKLLEANCTNAEKKIKSQVQKNTIDTTQLTKYIETQIENINPNILVHIFEPAILGKRNVIADGKDPGIRSLKENTDKKQVISWIATFFSAPHHSNYINIEKELYAIVYKNAPLTDFWKQKFIIYIIRYLQGVSQIYLSSVQERLEQNNIQLPSKI